MRETRKQKIARQRRFAQERAAERVMGPIRQAVEDGRLTIGPVDVDVPRPVKPPLNFSPPQPDHTGQCQCDACVAVRTFQVRR